MLRHCLEKATGNIVLAQLETVDLDRFEVLYEAPESNRGTVDVSTGKVIGASSSASNEAEALRVQLENAKIEEALAKNPRRGFRMCGIGALPFL